MNVKMILLSDAIFGNGVSIPGEEDISVQLDDFGFPYYRGSTFKGVFREELIRYLILTGKSSDEATSKASEMLGVERSDDGSARLVFSDLALSDYVRRRVLDELGMDNAVDIRDSLTNMRTFTAIDDNGMVKDGSLRLARCVDKGLVFYGTIDGIEAIDKNCVRDTLGMIKWIGTMRNRGFGRVKIEEV